MQNGSPVSVAGNYQFKVRSLVKGQACSEDDYIGAGSVGRMLAVQHEGPALHSSRFVCLFVYLTGAQA